MRIKNSRNPLILTVLSISILLSACTGAPSSNWPGVIATKDAAYVAYGNGVFAVNLNDGALLWRFPDKAQSGKNFYAPPALSEDGQILVGDFANTLYSIGLDGKQKWVFDKAKAGYVASPLVTKDSIYAPNMDDKLYALTLQGTLKWSFEAKLSLWAQPITDGKLIYLSSTDHSLYAIQPEDGKLKWSTDLGGALNGSPALGPDGILYVGTLGKEIIAVKSSNGQVVWRTPTDESVWGKLALQNGSLIFGDISGKIYSVSAADGKIQWSLPKQDGLIISEAAVLPDGFVLTATNETNKTSHVVSIDPTGKIQWNQTISGKLYSAPVFAGGHVVTAAMEADNLLVLFDNSGKQLWAFVAPK